MPGTSLDTALIDDYTAGMNVPLAAQAGYPCQADADGTNVEYVGPQEITGSGVWNGTSREIMVRGSGARAITLGPAPYKGYIVRVIDANGNAAGGDTITVGVSQVTVSGTQTITSDYDSKLWCFVTADPSKWARIG